MIKLLEDNTVICNDGSVVNSGHPEKTGCAKSRAVAEAFAYRHDILYNRADREHVDELVFDGKQIAVRCHVCEAADNPDGNVRLTSRHSHQDLTLDPLEDQSLFSDRVKLFASIVFDDAVKAGFIASLPRKEFQDHDEDGIPKTETVIVQIEAKTEQKLINGQLIEVVVQEASEVEQEVPINVTFIEYKGNLYPEGWTGVARP